MHYTTDDGEAFICTDCFNEMMSDNMGVKLEKIPERFSIRGIHHYFRHFAS